MAPKSRKLQPGEGPSSSRRDRRVLEIVEETGKERERRLEREAWENKIPLRNFKCERQVILPTHPEVEALIHRRGIGFVTQEVLGFSPSYVRQFYAKMGKTSSSSGARNEFVTEVENREIQVTPQSIAEVLDYRRPSQVGDPGEYVSLSANEYKSRMLKDPTKEYARNKIPVGDLLANYSTLNKIIHYHILPKTEKQLGMEDLEFLYMFMSDLVLDVDVLIFEAIREFRFTMNNSTEMPFPFLITRLCIRAEVRGYRNVRWEKGRQGPLSRASQKKSESLSVREVVPRGLPEGTGSWKKKLKVWLDTLFCRQQTIIERQERQDRRIDYCVETLGRAYGRPYVSPPRDVAAGEGTSTLRRRTKESVRKHRQEQQVREEEIEEEESESESEYEEGSESEEE